MLGKIWLTWMIAATLLASPAFAGWPSGQRAQIELGPISDWIDHGSALDRRAQHLW
jgi:hypothetical protein